MSNVAEQAAFLLDVGRLVQRATELGFLVTAGELYRTPEQQEIYVKTGRSRTMNSLHIQRRAPLAGQRSRPEGERDNAHVHTVDQALSPR